MANKSTLVGIGRIRPHFDGESPHLLCLGMVWGIPDFFNWAWGCTYPRHNTCPCSNY